MNKKALFLLGMLSVFTALPKAFADEITNLTVTPNGSQIDISWDAVSDEILSDSSGYALQWSIYQNKIRNNESGRKFLNQNTLTLRKGSFETNQVYYFRVYTYAMDGRQRILGNGSKILKWELSYDGEVESSYIEANDPVIADTSSSTSSSSTVSKFGTIRANRFDNFADIAWSRPTKLAKTEYDGFAFDVSKSIDMADPVIQFETGKSIYKARIKNLTPSTQYYVRGYFYKKKAGENSRFGAGTVKPFKTIGAIDRTKSTRASRNIKRIEKKSYFNVTIGGDTTDNSNSDTTSSSSSSSTSTPTVTKPSTTKEFQAKISELKKEINKLQADLRAWQKQLRDKLRAERSKK